MSNLFNGISEEDARLIRHNLDISQIRICSRREDFWE